MTFFAYVHAKPDTVNAAGIFYVGKGKGVRNKDMSPRNRHHGFVLNKYGKENILIGKTDCSNESIAFDLERGLIKCLRRMSVNLTNQTDGGEGSSGYKATDERRAQMSEIAKEVNSRSGVRQIKSESALKMNEIRWSDPEKAKKMSDAMKGKKKTRSEASDAARRANAQKGRTPEAIAKKSAASKKMWADPEFKAMMSEKRKLAWQDAEKRKAMLTGRSEGITKSWQDEIVKLKRINGIRAASAKRKE